MPAEDFLRRHGKVELDLKATLSFVSTVRSNPGLDCPTVRCSAFSVWRRKELPMTDTIYEHLDFYKKFAVNWWNHIGPADYITLLTLVGVIGYFMMLRGTKRLA